MKHSYVLTTIMIFLCSIAWTGEASAQEGSLVDGGLGGGITGTNPLGNVYVGPTTTAGTSAGVYITSVTHGDGSYTLHFIETDNAGIVVSHTTETHSGGEVTTGTEISNGQTLGDIVGGIDGAGTDSLFGGNDPMQCLSFHCDGGSGFNDPYSWSASNYSVNGG